MDHDQVSGRWAYCWGGIKEVLRNCRGGSRTEWRVGRRETLCRFLLSRAFLSSPVVLHISPFKDSQLRSLSLWAKLLAQISPSQKLMFHLKFIDGIIGCWSWSELGNSPVPSPYRCEHFSLEQESDLDTTTLSDVRRSDEGGTLTTSSLCHKVVSFWTLLSFSRSVVSDSLGPHSLQHTRLSCPSPSLGTCSNSCSLSWWWHPTIFSSCLLSQHQGLFQWVSSLHYQVAKVLEPQLQHQSFQWIFRIDFL